MDSLQTFWVPWIGWYELFCWGASGTNCSRQDMYLHPRLADWKRDILEKRMRDWCAFREHNGFYKKCWQCHVVSIFLCDC